MQERANSQVWFITGCSSGLGREIARAALVSGHCVVATAPRVEALTEFQDGWPQTATIGPLDVTQSDQVAAAVQAAIARFGRIDVLVNNAGYGYGAAIEEGVDAEVRTEFDTNFFSMVDLIKAVLPGMRARRSGTIVNMSSMLGLLGAAGSGYYCASKFAVEGLSECLAQELSPLGIRVAIVEPGPFRTNFAGSSLRSSPIAIDDYEDTVGVRRKQIAAFDGKQPGDPVRAAETIVRLVESSTIPPRLLLGKRCVDNVRSKLTELLEQINTWEAVSVAADYPPQ